MATAKIVLGAKPGGGVVSPFSAGRHDQTLLPLAARTADEFIEITNPGWDWMVLKYWVTAAGGPIVVTVYCLVWNDITQDFDSTGVLANDIFGGVSPTLSDADTGGITQHTIMGPGAATNLWATAARIRGAMAGPLPGKFEFYFKPADATSLTYGVTAMMGLGICHSGN